MDMLHLHLHVMRRWAWMPRWPHVMRMRSGRAHLSRVRHPVLPRARGQSCSHHLTLGTWLTSWSRTTGMHHLSVGAPDWLLPMHWRVHVRRRRRPAHLLRPVTRLALLLLLHVRVRWRQGGRAGVVWHPRLLLLRIPWRRRVSPWHARVHLLGVPGWHSKVLRMRVPLPRMSGLPRDSRTQKWPLLLLRCRLGILLGAKRLLRNRRRSRSGNS